MTIGAQARTRQTVTAIALKVYRLPAVDTPDSEKSLARDDTISLCSWTYFKIMGGMPFHVVNQ
jgi:hypothetical protein